MRINAAIREELQLLGQAMGEEADRLHRRENIPDHVVGDITNWSEEIVNIVAKIDGQGGHLWRSDTWVDTQAENPLKQLPEITLIEAARHAWDQVKDKPERKRYISSTEMDNALREVLQDSSWLPRFIDGRQWSPYMTKLVRMGVLRKVSLYGPRSRRPTGTGYILNDDYKRKEG